MTTHLRFRNHDLRADYRDVTARDSEADAAVSSPKRVNRKSQFVNAAAFTMIEVAICIGVIAFAIVAIIGVLPTGLRTQQEAHEDTIINQDGPYFLEMIRGGVHGLDHLTNFVEWIQVSNALDSVVYTNASFPLSIPPPTGKPYQLLTNGEMILRLLSIPKYMTNESLALSVTNTVSAYVHALSGGITEQGQASRDLGFGYLLTTEVMPAANFFAFSATNHFTNNDSSPLNLERSNRWLEAQQLARDVFLPTNATAFDVRVTCRWPYRPDFTAGNQRQTYRTLVSATLTNDDVELGAPVIFPAPRSGFYFLPQEFSNVQ